MRIITAPEPYIRQPKDITVFLAGGITNCWEWQDKVIEMLQNQIEVNLDNLVVFNPRRKNFPIDKPEESRKQIKWEFEMLEQCDIFSMYFCAGESNQPICMYELGRNICRMQMKYPVDWDTRIVITTEDDYKRAKDVRIQTSLATGFCESAVNNNIKYHVDEIIDQYIWIDELEYDFLE